MDKFNIENIKSLINKSLADDDLMGFCQSYFEDVYDKFGASQNKQQKILLLIDYCRRNLLLNKLLELLKKKNPAQYKANLPFIKTLPGKPGRGGLSKIRNPYTGQEIHLRKPEIIPENRIEISRPGLKSDEKIWIGRIPKAYGNAKQRPLRLEKKNLKSEEIRTGYKRGFAKKKSGSTSEPTTGVVLYSISGKMQVNNEHRCIIRIAHNKEVIMSDLKKASNEIITREKVTLTHYMEVEFIENTYFRIIAINDARQIVEKDQYTEWNFDVTPLHLGNFSLTFRISAEFRESGGLIRKQVVLTEKVEIVTYPVEASLSHVKVGEIDLNNPREAGKNMQITQLNIKYMNTKEKIDGFLASDHVKEALDLLLEKTEKMDTGTHNTLILLKGRFSNNESDNIIGILPRDEYLRTKAQIINSIQQVIRNIPLEQTAMNEEVPDGKERIKDTSKQKILFLAADPSDQARLEIDREYREIKKQIQLGKNRDSIEFLIPEFALTINELIRAMNQNPSIVHFTGHGEKNGIIITNPENETKPMPAKALERLFRQHKAELRLVFLSSCYSAKQAKAISALGFYVIGMNTAIEDLAAQSFATGLYNGLGEGKKIEQAYDDAMIQLEAEYPDSARIPVIWKDGVKLDL